MLLVAGLLLLWFGYQEYQSFSSEVNQLFGGTDSDRVIWILVAGAAATIGGLMGIGR